MQPTSSAMRRLLPVLVQTIPKPIPSLQSLAMVPRDACSRSLNIPEALLRMAPHPAARQAFDKFDIPQQQLQRSQRDWEFIVAKLNLALADSDSQAGKIRLNRSEILGMGLAVLQAGHHLNQKLATPAVVSLVFALLSRLPVDQPLLKNFDQFANELSARLLPYADLLSQSGDWYQKPSEARKRIIEETFQQIHLQAQRSELAPERSVSLEIAWQDTPVFSEATTLISDDRRSVQLALPRELTELDTETFGRKYDGLLQDLSCALIIPRISHAIFHVKQVDVHAMLNGERSATPAQWNRIIANSMAMGIQSCLTTESDGHSDPTQSFYQLPHDKEAWALRFGVLKAMINCPSVPDQYRMALEGYLSEHFDIFKAVRGLPDAPKVPTMAQAECSNPSSLPGSEVRIDSKGTPARSDPRHAADTTAWSIGNLYARNMRLAQSMYRAAELEKFLHGTRVGQNESRTTKVNSLPDQAALA